MEYFFRFIGLIIVFILTNLLALFIGGLIFEKFLKNDSYSQKASIIISLIIGWLLIVFFIIPLLGSIN